MGPNKARIRHYAGIDPSKRKTGVALITLRDKEIHKYTSLVIAPKELDDIQLLLHLRNDVDMFFKKKANWELLTGSAIEGPSLYSVNKSDDLGQVRGVLKVVLADGSKNLPHTIPPASLKKFAAGNGHAKKDAIVKKAEECGWGRLTEDEADAAWLAEIAWALSEKRKLSRKQIEAIDGIRKMTFQKTHAAKLSSFNL